MLNRAVMQLSLWVQHLSRSRTEHFPGSYTLAGSGRQKGTRAADGNFEHMGVISGQGISREIRGGRTHWMTTLLPQDGGSRMKNDDE